jgi:integrase
VSPRKPLPAGIRHRGAVFTYTWRDHPGRQYSREAGDTLAEAEGFKRRIDDQLALGSYQRLSTTTFVTYANAWIEVAAFAMIDAAPPDWQCPIATTLFTGLRLGELLGLSREDIDLPGRRLSVRHNLTEVNSRTPRLLREAPKSRAGLREVPIVEALAARLEQHLATLGPTDGDAVFASPVGTWMSKSNFYRDAWKPTRTAVGKESLTFHDLRHTAARSPACTAAAPEPALGEPAPRDLGAESSATIGTRDGIFSIWICYFMQE